MELTKLLQAAEQGDAEAQYNLKQIDRLGRALLASKAIDDRQRGAGEFPPALTQN